MLNVKYELNICGCKIINVEVIVKQIYLDESIPFKYIWHLHNITCWFEKLFNVSVTYREYNKMIGKYVSNTRADIFIHKVFELLDATGEISDNEYNQMKYNFNEKRKVLTEIICEENFKFVNKKILNYRDISEHIIKCLHNYEYKGKQEYEDDIIYIASIVNMFYEDPLDLKRKVNEYRTKLRVCNKNFEFRNEANLRDFIIGNLDKISFNDNKIILHENGIEYSTPVGRIDILAQNEHGDFVVIELKKNKTSDQALGQVLRYMGYLKSRYNKDVKGVIIAKEIDEKLKYACMDNTDISLVEYNTDFALQEVFL